VTERIGLVTNILLEPAYNPVLLAKVTASINQLSQGRFTLGLGVGARPDDFQVVGRSFADLGQRFDADQVDQLADALATTSSSPA
jgi:alkanesulfonate monooxygenase SsuD/methylene tetrahydromethanopterin reductase-like flavin-dependent oxidoreductase (luciferase family)